jgi:hypothetical protein
VRVACLILCGLCCLSAVGCFSLGVVFGGWIPYLNAATFVLNAVSFAINFDTFGTYDHIDALHRNAMANSRAVTLLLARERKREGLG